MQVCEGASIILRLIIKSKMLNAETKRGIQDMHIDILDCVLWGVQGSIIGKLLLHRDSSHTMGGDIVS